MSHSKQVLFLIGGLFLAMTFQNCSRVAVSDLTQDDLGSQGHTETAETLKTLQPALAVRGITCVLCHANIKANVITDLGLGTSQFMGGNSHFSDDASWTNNLAGAWQSSHITGTVIVPDVHVTPQAQAALGSAYQNQPLLKLADFMKVPHQTNAPAYLTPEESQAELLFHTVPQAGQERVIAKSEIQIRAPSESEIQNLAPQLWASAEASGATRVGSAEPLQLIKKGSGSQSYFQNDETATLECSKADIVIKGTLLLRRLKVNAAGGCRFYVSGSVFIEEGITYVGSGELQNLQITSASSIIMGLSTNILKNRLINDHRGLQLVSRNYSSLANQVVQESQNIGTLKDAVEHYSPRASINYHGLLLNAPIVHSRYLGEVNGTIISEAILFALGKFQFSFDPVFTKVNVLPLLSQPVLSVK